MMPVKFCANKMKALHDGRVSASVYVSVLLHASQKNPNPTPHAAGSIVGSCCHLRPGSNLTCVLLTPDS